MQLAFLLYGENTKHICNFFLANVSQFIYCMFLLRNLSLAVFHHSEFISRKCIFIFRKKSEL